MATTIDKICRVSNLDFFLTQIKKLFVSKESGKGLSTNDYSTDEKNKLAGIQAGANNYTLPKASATVLGGVKVGAGLAITTDGTLSASGTDLTPYAKTADLAAVAKSGKYSDLSGTPAALKNPAAITFTGAATGTYDGSAAVSVTIPTIPTKLSAFQNDAGYVTAGNAEATYAKKSDITTVFRYRGSVDTYADLPVNGVQVGDTYNITAADASHSINAGDNVSWNGNSWDNLAGIVDLSAYAKSSDVANTYMKKSDYPMATDADILALFN